jgi:hypothetical protein
LRPSDGTLKHSAAGPRPTPPPVPQGLLLLRPHRRQTPSRRHSHRSGCTTNTQHPPRPLLEGALRKRGPRRRGAAAGAARAPLAATRRRSSAGTRAGPRPHCWQRPPQAPWPRCEARRHRRCQGRCCSCRCCCCGWCCGRQQMARRGGARAGPSGEARGTARRAVAPKSAAPTSPLSKLAAPASAGTWSPAAVVPKPSCLA